MGNLSQVNEPRRHAVWIPGPAHLRDHRILDRPVLPAAHALCLMADTAAARTGTPLRASRDAVFQGFLYLPDPPAPIPGFVDILEEGDGRFTVSLLSRIAARSGPVSRVKEHLRAGLLPAVPVPPPPPEALAPPSGPDAFPVDRDALYRELVPFGPAFRNVTGPVLLAPQGAWAGIAAPPRRPASPALGSPFVFDAALHAANVWTQRYRAMVAFPVGYELRQVHEPSRPGGRYLCHAVPRPSPVAGTQILDLWVLDSQGRPVETALGLRMRELFPGKLRPPDWILP